MSVLSAADFHPNLEKKVFGPSKSVTRSGKVFLKKPNHFDIKRQSLLKKSEPDVELLMDPFRDSVLPLIKGPKSGKGQTAIFKQQSLKEMMEGEEEKKRNLYLESKKSKSESSKGFKTEHMGKGIESIFAQLTQEFEKKQSLHKTKKAGANQLKPTSSGKRMSTTSAKKYKYGLSETGKTFFVPETASDVSEKWNHAAEQKIGMWIEKPVSVHHREKTGSRRKFAESLEKIYPGLNHSGNPAEKDFSPKGKSSVQKASSRINAIHQGKEKPGKAFFESPASFMHDEHKKEAVAHATHRMIDGDYQIHKPATTPGAHEKRENESVLLENAVHFNNAGLSQSSENLPNAEALNQKSGASAQSGLSETLQNINRSLDGIRQTLDFDGPQVKSLSHVQDTDVQWLEEENIAQSLADLLKRQAMRRGIDLS